MACSETGTLSPLPPDATILAFGDSLTYGTGVSAADSYPAVLESLTGRTVIRSGVPGEISKDGLGRLERELAESRPTLVVLCHGGNDVLRRLNPDATERNLRAMITLARGAGAEVVVLAVPRFGLFPSPPDYYASIAEDLAVPVEFNILADLLSDASMKSDQVHFNRAGYRAMAEAVESMLWAEGAL